ncbi:CMGC/RCK/MAK protein kinase Pit1 [Schizosaccharomyces japonicus yFS275]|uniref:CMGC/RCK/MAK protein kinase Pit1 n=1 Tax=Schizosaccharomyces japonicus (strain yFS275 / FY16936) TaxID=402676 RepID=B6K0Z4_SCHJY|nr:CMGC/RCK/MAK protein kinase Pit1 [Schizosaccharomyces japonicus yFS275]EEB07615.1 CMGC/RCK/MAK protein kinase Pit1 [Schizosaccharomyces japonicus yFS275]
MPFRGKFWGTSKEKSVTTCTKLEDMYDVFQEIGDGTFGSVRLARRRNCPGELFAIKSMKTPLTKTSDSTRLREVRSLAKIPRHDNVVKVFELIVDAKKHLHMVMENLQYNLLQLITKQNLIPFSIDAVKDLVRQIFCGLEHIHLHGYFHRDMKPENILISEFPGVNSSRYVVKIADFGLARELRSSPPYTEYISTRWYRAPELLLRDPSYSSPVDVYAVGCMAFEIATLRPIFPGRDDLDQLYKMCEVLGSPKEWPELGDDVGGGPWPEAYELAKDLGFQLPTNMPLSFHELFSPPWNNTFASMLTAILKWDPKKRPTASECLAMPFLYVPPKSLYGLPNHSTTTAYLQKKTSRTSTRHRSSSLVESLSSEEFSEITLSSPRTNKNLFGNVSRKLVGGFKHSFKKSVSKPKADKSLHSSSVVNLSSTAYTDSSSSNTLLSANRPLSLAAPVARTGKLSEHKAAQNILFPVLPELRPTTPLNVKLSGLVLVSPTPSTASSSGGSIAQPRTPSSKRFTSERSSVDHISSPSHAERHCHSPRSPRSPSRQLFNEASTTYSNASTIASIKSMSATIYQPLPRPPTLSLTEVSISNSSENSSSKPSIKSEDLLNPDTFFTEGFHDSFDELSLASTLRIPKSAHGA